MYMYMEEEEQAEIQVLFTVFLHFYFNKKWYIKLIINLMHLISSIMISLLHTSSFDGVLFSVHK